MGVLEATTRLGGAGLKPDRMRVDGQILALFPKHCESWGGTLGNPYHEYQGKDNSTVLHLLYNMSNTSGVPRREMY